MMQISKETLRRLGGPAAIAIAMLAIGVAALVATSHYADRAATEYGSARADRAAIQTRLAQATDEEREIQRRLLDYQQLRQRGVLGDERRLDWVETIRKIKAERGIYEIKYTIEPRRPVDYPGLKQEPGVELLMSRVKLEAAVLHEGDLVSLLNDIRARVAPIVVVRSCALQRTDRSRSLEGSGPRLRSECAIDFVTIRDAKEVP